ncbi:Serine carboxypeptidase-like 35 [Acorus gramineus]|uniref:Carboxypeptidase n=1 Tax=Acorus gramineus TaxID=55184 RepID=A0AAV9B9G4_ACOGR|nr:Serine carboxypeptidase-like 35 [Acorus gramineus]
MWDWLLVLVLAVSGGQFGLVRGDGGRESDRVRGLPGQPSVAFGHYAGYVNLHPREGKSLFYWFFEAEGGVAGKPLLLWLNGVANLLFLESPVGVGFSYTNKSGDLKVLGDKITAEDSHTFLINWFQRFPEFRSHDFYIAGESYAGHYVPQLAELIYEGNKGASKDSFINLKGFMIGNAVINDATDQVGMVEYAWSHAIISDELHDSLNKECDFNSETTTPSCNSVSKSFLQAFSDIDIYSIFTPICLSSLGKSNMKKKKLVVAPRAFSQHDMWHRLPSGYDPCTESYVTKYFNREDVQNALHANVTKLSYPYSTCSGDMDARVPVTSTRMSVNGMKLQLKGEWRVWFHKGQVGGWTEDYEGGLTFATVRGAGHQVPVLAPSRSLSLLSHFLSGKPLPRSRF